MNERVQISEDEPSGAVRIVIPSRTHWFIVACATFWSIGWAFGQVSALLALPFFFWWIFFYIWLGFWTLLGVLLGYMLAWNLVGREVIEIDNGTLNVSWKAGPFQGTRSYDLEQVRNLRFEPQRYRLFSFSIRNAWQGTLDWLGIGKGNVAFDYQGIPQRFGGELSESESRRIIHTIQQRSKIKDDGAEELFPLERV